jgi:hypothetical protein
MGMRGKRSATELQPPPKPTQPSDLQVKTFCPLLVLVPSSTARIPLYHCKVNSWGPATSRVGGWELQLSLSCGRVYLWATLGPRLSDIPTSVRGPRSSPFRALTPAPGQTLGLQRTAAQAEPVQSSGLRRRVRSPGQGAPPPNTFPLLPRPVRPASAEGFPRASGCEAGAVPRTRGLVQPTAPHSSTCPTPPSARPAAWPGPGANLRVQGPNAKDHAESAPTGSLRASPCLGRTMTRGPGQRETGLAGSGRRGGRRRKRRPDPFAELHARRRRRRDGRAGRPSAPARRPGAPPTSVPPIGPPGRGRREGRGGAGACGSYPEALDARIFLPLYTWAAGRTAPRPPGCRTMPPRPRLPARRPAAAGARPRSTLGPDGPAGSPEVGGHPLPPSLKTAPPAARPRGTAAPSRIPFSVTFFSQSRRWEAVKLF